MPFQIHQNLKLNIKHFPALNILKNDSFQVKSNYRNSRCTLFNYLYNYFNYHLILVF